MIEEKAKPMRIVVAEDEAVIRMDLKEILQTHGCDVVGEARNGACAIRLVRDTLPDCVFMDVQMQGQDGLAAARVIAEEGLAPVVVLTAFSQEAFVQEAVDAGVMAYVTKPFSESDIIPALHIARSRFEEARALAAEIDDLQERLETRKLLERAKGILMKQGMSETEAFSRLRKSAMNSRKSLKEIAQALITVDELTG